MLIRVLVTYIVAVSSVGGSAYYMFDWFPIQGIIYLAAFSAVAGGIALLFVKIRTNQAGGGGDSARASKYSKGARGGDDR